MSLDPVSGEVGEVVKIGLNYLGLTGRGVFVPFDGVGTAEVARFPPRLVGGRLAPAALNSNVLCVSEFVVATAVLAEPSRV